MPARGRHLDYFREPGYEYEHGLQIAPDGDSSERSEYRQVVLGGSREHDARGAGTKTGRVDQVCDY